MHRAWRAALLVILITLPCHATIIRVDLKGGGDYLSIGEGVAAADVGDTVLVAPGTYAGPLNRGIRIHEGALLLISEDGPETTIIDGEHEGWILSLESSGTTMEGYTITHGGLGNGAALGCYPGVTIRNCVFVDNTGVVISHAGPGYTDWLIVEGCLFWRNGAGINATATLWVADCNFLENDGYCIRSAGPDIDHAPGYLAERSTFHSNSRCGIRTTCSPGTISHCVFTENQDGALSISEGWGDISHCTIVHNYSPTAAAVFTTPDFHSNGATISNSIIAFNSCCGAVDGSGYSVTYNIVFGNAGGDSLSGHHHNNHYVDPRLCEIYGGDVSPCADSPALAWGYGAYDEPGCDACGTPVEQTSWGTIKAMFR